MLFNIKIKWHELCDLFTLDPEFQKRSEVEKTNCKKQEIQSTSGSKSHDQVCEELERIKSIIVARIGICLEEI